MRKFKKRDNDLLVGYRKALKELSPRKLILGLSLPSQGSAVLCWGKVAEDFYSVLPVTPKHLVISPGQSEHPVPGAGSFRAGRKLLRFFVELKKDSIKKLDVYLSGGASSLAWLPADGLSQAEVVKRLKILYRKSLNIRELNRRRAKLCQFKEGGAARLAQSMDPGLRIRVFCVSDVSPFGMGTLGGGPFFSRGISHRVLADNQTLRQALAKILRAQDCGFVGGSVTDVFKKIKNRTRACKAGVFIWGCEPFLSVPRKHGSGGRQTHLACLLLKEFYGEIQSGKLEVLCVSSDGVDGCSKGAGAFLARKNLDKNFPVKKIDRALKDFNSAQVLKSLGALIPVLKTGTNVQDVVVIRARK